VLDAADSVEVKPSDVRPEWTDEMPSGDINVCEIPLRLNSTTNMTTSDEDTASQYNVISVVFSELQMSWN